MPKEMSKWALFRVLHHVAVDNGTLILLRWPLHLQACANSRKQLTFYQHKFRDPTMTCLRNKRPKFDACTLPRYNIVIISVWLNMLDGFSFYFTSAKAKSYLHHNFQFLIDVFSWLIIIKLDTPVLYWVEMIK